MKWASGTVATLGGVWLLIQAIVFGVAGCEACTKYWSITGAVTDKSSGLPIEGVLVTGPPKVDGSGRATALTDSSGRYTITDQSLGGLEGLQLKFEKGGYTSTESSAFTADEAGTEHCGSITITRDQAMTAE